MSDIEKAIKLFNNKKYDEAKNLFEELIQTDSANEELLRHAGLCLFEKGDYQGALEYFKKAVNINPSAENNGNIGICYYRLKNYENAQVSLITSIIEKYEDRFATTLEKVLLVNHNDEAMLGLKLMMHENHPNDIIILRDITNLTQKMKKFDMAIEYFDILLKKCPKDYVAWNNLGLIYEELGDWQKAYDCYKKSLSLNDFFSPNFNLGILTRKLHRFQDSINYLKKAVKQNPNSPQPRYSLSMSYMMLKDFKNGYPLYAKHMTIIMPSYYKNEWDGKENQNSTICLFATGGLGDMIMFARYFKYLKGHFKKIFILLPETLHKIFKSNFPYLEIIDSKVIFEDYDYAITPMHILKIFDLDFNQIVPNPEGFMKADENLIQNFKEKFFNHDKLKIGINWHGNREGTRTFFNRTMPIEKFEPIFEKYKDKAAFYSVQKDESHIECQKYPFVTDLYDEIKDFNDTAAILKNLDLLISIDSSPVHMAGALGTKTYTVLPYAGEWRWFSEGDKTIWYDSVELFRQDTEKDWDSAIKKVLERMSAIY